MSCSIAGIISSHNQDAIAVVDAERGRIYGTGVVKGSQEAEAVSKECDGPIRSAGIAVAHNDTVRVDCEGVCVGCTGTVNWGKATFT